MRPRSGFTLVELLVVICIIAILAGLVTVGLNAAMVNARTASTETFLQALSGACNQYSTRWGDFPPSTIDDVGGRAPNDVNNGIEALVACLASERRGGKLIAVDEEQYANADGDSTGANVTGWFFGDNKLRELTDKFGFGITYLHHRDFAKPRPQVLKYKVAPDGETVTIAPEKSAATSTWAGAGRFQLRSVGKDGKPGTGDDIRGQ
ncbi:MAG TPA: prepilin-type N-terminal cleavage/methylation domain-containing protein [Planctomycetota bacterium]